MPDGKYGRLFTEEDVALIVQETLAIDEREPTRIHRRPVTDVWREAVANAEARADARGEGVFTFSADEPLLLLRGQDALARGAIWTH